MRIAERIARLGTETAFAVSSEAAAFAAKGNKVYPFHLGDMNIITPSNIIEAAVKAMKDGKKDGKTGYCPNAGIPQLRETLAADVSASHGVSYSMENVAIQPGGKPSINKFLLALMNPGDEVIYPNPGYPIYESQIEFQGGKAIRYGYLEGEDNFKLDMEAIERQITPRTKLLLLNDLQNPTRSHRAQSYCCSTICRTPPGQSVPLQSLRSLPNWSSSTTSTSCVTRPTSTFAMRERAPRWHPFRVCLSGALFSTPSRRSSQ